MFTFTNNEVLVMATNRVQAVNKNIVFHIFFLAYIYY